MATRTPLIPRGMAGFTARRLIRALISLLLFQIILFAAIQALPEHSGGMTQAQMMEQVAASQPRSSGNAGAPSAGSSSAPTGSGAPAAVSPEVQKLLDDANRLEALGMLDDAYAVRAEAEELAASQPVPADGPPEAAQSPEPEPGPAVTEPEAGPAVDPALMADAAFLEEIGMLDDAAAVKEAAVLENPAMLQEAAGEVDPAVLGIVEDPSLLEAAGLAQDGTPLQGAETGGPVPYEEGLAAIRPPDLAIVEQFLAWMASFLTGDLGVSTAEPTKSVSDILGTKLPRTLLLFLPSVILGFLLGLWLGKRIAWQHRGWVDTGGSLGGVAFYTSFPPWLAFLAISLFAVNLRLFPPEKLINPILWLRVDLTLNQLIVRVLLTASMVILALVVLFRLTRRLWWRAGARVAGGAIIAVLAVTPWITSGLWTVTVDLLEHLTLPMLVLILLSFGETMLIMRTTMQETKEADHIPLARARGLKDSEVRDRHVARVAMLPVITRFIMYLPIVIIGAFAIEQYFSWDGMGQRLVQAANENDLPVLMGILTVVGVGILLAHVILDITTAQLDPRLRDLGPQGESEPQEGVATA